VTTYRIRWVIAIGTTLPLPLFGGLVIAVALRPRLLGIAVGLVVALIFTARMSVRIRRRSLTITPTGLDVQRDTYAMQVPWEAIVAVTKYRIQRYLPVEELRFTQAELIGRTSRGQVRSAPDLPAGAPALHRIQVSLYDRHWRAGPIGDELRRRAILGADAA
jgi:hypothetical protein